MAKLLFTFFIFAHLFLNSQVGINTQNPETTFEVVGKPDDENHFDGIIPPRITGDQLAGKFYSASKKGALVYVLTPPTNISGQLVNISASGIYYFDGSLWQSSAKNTEPTEYRIILTFDPQSSAELTATSNWSEPFDASGNINSYLTSVKTYSIGTKNFAGLKGFVSFRKIQGIVNIKFQMYRSSDSTPINGAALIGIHSIFSDIGYVPNQIVLLHTENFTQFFPALLENFSIHIPQISLTAMSVVNYTYGEVQGFSTWKRPYYP